MPAATNYLSYWLDGPQDKDRLAALSAGNVVTVKATLHGRTTQRNEGGGLLRAALELRPCQIVSVTPSAKR